MEAGNERSSLDLEKIIGGIEGDSCESMLILYNSTGEELVVCTGPGINQWLIGVEECQKRLCDLIQLAKKECDIPENTPLFACGLCLCGVVDDNSVVEMKTGLMRKYPFLSKTFFIGPQLQGYLISSRNYEGGIILRAEKGSAALLMNTDGSLHRAGFWGHILGDKGSAYWVAVKAVKVVFAELELVDNAPNMYSIAYLWKAIKRYFGVEHSYEVVPYFYINFRKDKISGLYKWIARGAKKHDLLCQWIFSEAGRHLAKLVISLFHKVDQKLADEEGGLFIICSGSVWNDWDLIKYGFIMETDNELMVQKYQLHRPHACGAHGAAILAARKVSFDLRPRYSEESEPFYIYNRDDPKTTIFNHLGSSSMRSTRSTLVSLKSLSSDYHSTDDTIPAGSKTREKPLRSSIIKRQS